MMEKGRGFDSGTIQYIGDNYHLLATENGGDDNETALKDGQNAFSAQKLIKLKYPKYWCVVSKSI